jgi:hypothetical protein
MKRRNFLRNMAIAIPAASCMSYFDLLAAPNIKKVKITNIKCVRVKIGFRPSLIIKIETDAGVVGIGQRIW